MPYDVTVETQYLTHASEQLRLGIKCVLKGDAVVPMQAQMAATLAWAQEVCRRLEHLMATPGGE